MKKGDKITIIVDTPVVRTEEFGIIEIVTDNEIFIENLKIPFDKKTGYKKEIFYSARVFIAEIALTNEH